MLSFSLTISPKSHTLKLSRIGCGLVSMAEKQQTINLLPHQTESLLNQFLDWALTIGRLLVILVEMVALGTFLFRFGLDMQIVNLHDKIKSESFIVDNFKDAEATFRDIQERLTTVKQYTAVGDTTTNTFTQIAKLGQDKVTFKDLTVSTTDAKIVVEAQSSAALSQFVNALKSNVSITAVSIDKVVNDTTDAQITVYISATFKKSAFAQSVDQQTNGTNATINP